MGISENAYINRKALELIDEIVNNAGLYGAEENFIRTRLGEVRGIVAFAFVLQEGDNKDAD